MASVSASDVAVADFIFLVRVLPYQRVKYRADRAHIDEDGMAESTSAPVSRLRGEAHLAVRVSSDFNRGVIRPETEGHDVSEGFVNRGQGGQSAFSAVMVGHDGERQSVGFGGSDLAEGAVRLDTVPCHDVILLDSGWPRGLKRTAEPARHHDVPSIVDGERFADTETLPLAVHSAFSKQGILENGGEETSHAALKSMAGRHSIWPCATDEANGTDLTRNGGIDRSPAFEAAAANTLGAGDVWRGAFALIVKDEEKTVRFAYATLRCTRHGRRACYPARDEVNIFIRQHS